MYRDTVCYPSAQLFSHTLNIQCANLKCFHPEILKKSNHILRNCKNADIGNLMYGIPDLTLSRLNITTFLCSRIWNFSTVVSAHKNKFPGGNFLNLHTVDGLGIQSAIPQ